MNHSEAGRLGYIKVEDKLKKAYEAKRERAQETYQRNLKACPTCGQILPYEKRQNTFCSHSCAAVHNNLGVCRHSNPRKKNKYCKNCGARLLHDKQYSLCCSHDCSQTYRYKNYIAKWKAGKVSGYSKRGISGFVRRYIREKYDSHCAQCGWSERNLYTGTVPLEIHHIDGDYKNNSESNLILLCPNCHSLTSTYKSTNKGNGRDYRRKRL